MINHWFISKMKVNFCLTYLMMAFIFLKIESLENISSVKKIIKQIISHSSKVLHFSNPEDKKLEVRLILLSVLPSWQ